MSVDDLAKDRRSANSDVWRSLVADPGSPGFSVRTTYPMNRDGVEVMLERWAAGTNEPPHFHPGDDMTVVIKGTMTVQFYEREGDHLKVDGGRVTLNTGDVGYVKAERVHDAQYLEECELVYVHNGAFAFNLVDAPVN